MLNPSVINDVKNTYREPFCFDCTPERQHDRCEHLAKAQGQLYIYDDEQCEKCKVHKQRYTNNALTILYQVVDRYYDVYTASSNFCLNCSPIRNYELHKLQAIVPNALTVCYELTKIKCGCCSGHRHTHLPMYGYKRCAHDYLVELGIRYNTPPPNHPKLITSDHIPINAAKLSIFTSAGTNIQSSVARSLLTGTPMQSSVARSLLTDGNFKLDMIMPIIFEQSSEFIGWEDLTPEMVINLKRYIKYALPIYRSHKQPMTYKTYCDLEETSIGIQVIYRFVNNMRDWDKTNN